MDSPALIALYLITGVAFIGALNTRGRGRVLLAALLVLACLLTALWQTTLWRARLAAGLPTGGVVEVSGGGEAPGPGRGAPAGTPASPLPGPGAGGSVDLREDFAAGVTGLVARALVLRADLAAEDPARARALSDSAYRAFEARAGEYVLRSRRLRERAATLASAAAAGTAFRSPAPAGADLSSVSSEEVVESLNEALQSLVVAARDLRAFFRATGREEEQRLGASFRRGVEAAAAPLRRAAAGTGAGFSVPGD